MRPAEAALELGPAKVRVCRPCANKAYYAARAVDLLRRFLE